MASNPPQLRSFRVSDARRVLEAFSSAKDIVHGDEIATIARAEEYITRLTGSLSDHPFAVVADGGLVGAIGIIADVRNRNGQIWYWMHAGYRGRGWASAAARTVADWALARGGYKRLELSHTENNSASGGVARAAGFILEGRMREKFYAEVERIDVLTYGRICTDQVPEGHRLSISGTATARCVTPP